MRRRFSLGFQVFLAITGVALATALVVGVFARNALAAAFDRYLASLPAARAGMGGRGMGRMMLGAAEQAFVSSVDNSVLGAALLAIAIATIVAVALSAYLSNPLRRLTTAAEQLAAGDLAHRVDVNGPMEVAVLGDSFNRMADSLERAEELRRKLVADVAHELRNPLAAARAQAEGMAEGILVVDPERLGSLVDDLVHLSALIDDLQELAIADAGRLRYDMREVDLGEVVAREADRIEPLVAESVRLVRDIAAGPVIVTGDERRLAQVVRNLLNNAVRHTGQGSVTVAAAVEAGRAVVRVTDTGEGISADDLPHVFQRFYRADTARASDTGGAGLGLAISERIVRDHGGEMFAASELGAGSAIGFALPLESGETRA